MPAPVISSQILSNYAINEGQQIVASASVTNIPDAVAVIINNKAFNMSAPLTPGAYVAIIDGLDIGICAGITARFIATNALGGAEANAPSALTVTSLGNYNIAAVEAKIKALLLTITALKTVLDYEPLDFPILPAASLFYSDFTQVQTEAVSFTVKHTWILRLYVRLDDAKRAQDTMKSLIQSVLAKLKSDQTFGGAVFNGKAISGSVGAILARENPLIVSEIKLEGMREED
jgi:hypothetical protein